MDGAGSTADRSRRAAIVAHHDVNDRLDASFLELVDVLRSVCERVIVVSTSDVASDRPLLPEGTLLLCRPNLGYDFMSYRAGLRRLAPDESCGVVFLVNSTVLVLDRDRFRSTLIAMADAAERRGAVGVTASRQEAWHLQSFLVALGQAALRSPVVRRFFDEIRPLNSKAEVILRYEIGLTDALRRAGLEVSSCERFTVIERSIAVGRWLRTLAVEEGDGCRWLGPLRRWRLAQQWNPVHFAAGPLARRRGFCKAELWVQNPKGIDLAPVRCAANADTLLNLDSYRERSKAAMTETDSPRFIPALDRRKTLQWRVGDPPTRVAVVAHVFHAELLGEMLHCVRSIVEPCHLYVTTPFEADAAEILDRASRVAAAVTVSVVPNRGRDMGPFLALWKTGWLDRHRVALKIHTKRSGYSPRGDEWRRQLLHDLAGTSFRARRTLGLFDDPRVGMAGPLRFFLTNPRYWGANRQRTADLLAAVRPEVDCGESTLAFFAGSMFWFRPEAFASLSRTPTQQLDFEPEQGQRDGTLAHAYERVLATLSRADGFRVTALELSGADIFDYRCDRRGVPVLE